MKLKMLINNKTRYEGDSKCLSITWTQSSARALPNSKLEYYVKRPTALWSAAVKIWSFITSSGLQRREERRWKHEVLLRQAANSAVKSCGGNIKFILCAVPTLISVSNTRTISVSRKLILILLQKNFAEYKVISDFTWKS